MSQVSEWPASGHTSRVAHGRVLTLPRLLLGFRSDPSRGPEIADLRFLLEKTTYTEDSEKCIHTA